MSQTERLVSMKVVQELTSYSRTHIARLEKAGKFPRRVRLSPHPRGRMAWLESEVNEWILERIRERSD
jgi:prophage regulatory protein